MKDRVLHLFSALLFSLSATAQMDTATIHIVRKGCIVDLTMGLLKSLPLREATMTERDGNKATFQGVWLGEVLDLGCDSTARLDKHGTLRSVVKVTAVDGFTAVVAMAEAVHDFSERPSSRRIVSSIDQSSPWSVAENTCRPTVTGRDSTEFVMMSGHRKLFQW